MFVLTRQLALYLTIEVLSFVFTKDRSDIFCQHLKEFIKAKKVLSFGWTMRSLDQP